MCVRMTHSHLQKYKMKMDLDFYITFVSFFSVHFIFNQKWYVSVIHIFANCTAIGTEPLEQCIDIKKTNKQICWCNLNLGVRFIFSLNDKWHKHKHIIRYVEIIALVWFICKTPHNIICHYMIYEKLFNNAKCYAS